MGVSFERSILCVIVLLSCFYAWRACAVQQVHIKKVFHHKAVQNTNIELGSCVIYVEGLTKKFITETTRSSGDGEEERSFFIPYALVNTQECKKMIDTINKSKSDSGYALSIDLVKQPAHGLRVCFSYSKDNCIICCNHFDSIQQEKGIVFNVYNKSLVQSLKKQQSPVIRTASIATAPVIFLDPGHGGSDTGAVGVRGAQEKDLCLGISLEVKKFLAQAGYTVYLSRESDVTVPLDMRTYMAHEKGADLLVSIHANASKNKNAEGIELFFLDMDFINNNYIINQKTDIVIASVLQQRSDLSTCLAHLVCNEIFKNVSLDKKFFKNRGIKKAVAQVLLGAYIPAILIELGFVTNMHDVSLLTNKKYQQIVAQSIAYGVQKYCMKMHV